MNSSNNNRNNPHGTQEEDMDCGNEKDGPGVQTLEMSNVSDASVGIEDDTSHRHQAKAQSLSFSSTEHIQLSPINPQAQHTSFDEAQLLSTTTGARGRPPPAVAVPPFRPAQSWEGEQQQLLRQQVENPLVVAPEATSAARKHAHFDFSEAGPAAGTRAQPSSSRAGQKLPRYSSDDVLLANKTPLRPALWSKKPAGKDTPVSAKRRRSAVHQRRSPRVAQLTPQRTQHQRQPQQQHIYFPPSTLQHATSNTPQNGDRLSMGRPVIPSILHDGADITPSGLSVRRKKKSIGTVTTAASSHVLETTIDTEDGSMDTNDAPFRFTSFPASLPRVNHPLRTPAAAGGRGSSTSTAHGTIRKRMSFTDTLTEALNGSRDDATHNTSLSSLPVEESNMYAESDDEVDHADPPRSPSGTPVARTRLDFNAALSPSGGIRRGSHTPIRSRMQDVPKTPHEVKMHFQMNAANCSPIRGIPEEDCEASSGKSVGATSQRNLSHETTSSDMSSKPSRMRPLPDMEAFEDNGSTTPTRERSGDDTGSTRSHPHSPQLLCPPTPVRTPAWAHADSSGSQNRGTKKGRIHRHNSLITTKVLAICSPHVLNERNSLENSMLEEEDQGTGLPNNSTSISDLASAGGHSFDTETVVAQQNSADDASGDWFPVAGRSARHSLGESSNQTLTLSTSFEILSLLGSGTFADVYKVRAKSDGQLYAVKKNRRQFRGKRDREKALGEVRYMQRLQSAVSPAKVKSSYSLYLLFFFQAWQEDGHFFCQTELCCRDTCRELIDSLRREWLFSQTRYPSFRRLPVPPSVQPGSEADSLGRLTPEPTVWKMAHDVCAGLSHIHSHGLVHYDIKPSNIFFIPHPRFGAMCKIGDFGMAGEIGTREDGQEGDQKYMPLESLGNDARHPSADIFSLGLTLYELASILAFEIPSDGQRWHDLRSASTHLALPACRSLELVRLIQSMVQPDRNGRPSADDVLDISTVSAAGHECESFLRDYMLDIAEFDEREEHRASTGNREQTPVIPGRPRVFASPTFGTLMPMAPVFSPDAA